MGFSPGLTNKGFGSIVDCGLQNVSLKEPSKAARSCTTIHAPTHLICQILPAPPELPCRPTVLVLLGQPIPVGRPYRTQPNEVLKMLTAKKNSSSETSSDSHSDTSSDSSSRHSSSGRPISNFPCDSPTATSAGPSYKRCMISMLCIVLLMILRLLRGTNVRVEVGTAAEEEAETMPNATHSGMTQDATNELIAKRVEEALKAYDAARNPGTKTEMENGQQDDNVEANVNNGNGKGNGKRNPNVNNGGVVPVARECTYQDFASCQPLNFKGTKGVVGLARWFEKMEIVFHISNCPPRYQVKYASCTLLDGALTWWNSHKRIVGVDATYSMTWKAVMKLMIEVYCPRNEIKKIETELWNLTVKANDVTAYNQRFQELTLLCTKMVPKEEIRNECPNLKNQNRKNKIGNKNGNNEAKARAYAIGGRRANPDSNVITGTFLLNNRYASMLFDSGAVRSFVSTTFNALLDVIPSTLDTSYVVELADGRNFRNKCDT
ncbi:putative reverse transcriptase domain-containing protein [Tanacetum coccineum]